MKSILLIFFIINLVYSQKYTISEANVSFYAVTTIVGLESSFDGSGTSLSGYIDMNTKRIHLKYNLWDLKTGIELRDDHMHENYLETERYPTAEFRGTILKNENNFITVNGFFDLHGVKKKITAEGKISGDNLIATWNLSLNDFNIPTPRRFLIAKISSTLKMVINCKLSEN